MKTFEEIWAEKEKEGFQYGRDALEHVKSGWNLQKENIEELKEELEEAEHEAAQLEVQRNKLEWELRAAKDIITAIQSDTVVRCSKCQSWVAGSANNLALKNAQARIAQLEEELKLWKLTTNIPLAQP